MYFGMNNDKIDCVLLLDIVRCKGTYVTAISILSW